jgi:hypothetical protein
MCYVTFVAAASASHPRAQANEEHDTRNS